MQKIVILIMCWNATVSLNTFLFSIGMLCLMIYNNHYTPYKIEGFNIYWYFFILSFCTIQLIEYFLWTHLTNKKLNYLFSSFQILNFTSFLPLLYLLVASSFGTQSLQPSEIEAFFFSIKIQSIKKEP